MAKKQVLAVVKIQIPAGQASPAPPVGTALGPYGLQIMDFCKEYNARTEAQRGQVVPVEITVFEDRTFTFILKTPPTAELIKKAAKLDKGAGDPLREPAGSITKGRHDPCVGIRAVPVGEAMMACVLLDHILLHRGQIGGDVGATLGKIG